MFSDLCETSGGVDAEGAGDVDNAGIFFVLRAVDLDITCCASEEFEKT